MTSRDDPLHADFQPVFSLRERITRHHTMVCVLLAAMQRLDESAKHNDILRETSALPKHIGKFRSVGQSIHLVLAEAEAVNLPIPDRETLALKTNAGWGPFVEQALIMVQNGQMEFDESQNGIKAIIERFAHHLELCAWTQHYQAHKSSPGYWLAFEPMHARLLGGADAIRAQIETWLVDCDAKDGGAKKSSTTSWLSALGIDKTKNGVQLKATATLYKGQVIPEITASIGGFTFEQWALLITIDKPLPLAFTAGLVGRPARELIECPWLADDDLIIKATAHEGMTVIELAELEPVVIPMPRVIFDHHNIVAA